jgi:peroxiredoxin
LERHKDDFAQAGLQVVAVALGEPKHARRYCGRLAPSITCYCNQTADVYRAYGLKRMAMVQALQPGLLLAGARAAAGGHVQGETTGDPRMLPGTFVVDTDGLIRFAYYSSHAGDHPNLAALLQEMAAKGMITRS